MQHASEPSPQLRPDRPFTTQQFRAAGFEPAVLRRRTFVQIFKGIWAYTEHVDALTRIRAAVLAHPEGAIASHFSAARIYELPVPDHPFEHVTVFRTDDRRCRQGLKSHVTKRRKRVQLVRGIPVVEPVVMFIQLAGQLSLVDLVVLGDALVRKFGIRPAELRRRCRSSGDYYAKAAAAAAEYVRSGVDSPMESILRMLIVLAGLPEPQTNAPIRNDDGTLRRRFDLYYAEGRVIVEYDGRHHALDAAQWRHDLERREELDQAGYRIVVVTAEGVYREPRRTLERVRRALVERGVRGVPPIQDDWREHFPAWSRTAA